MGSFDYVVFRAEPKGGAGLSDLGDLAQPLPLCRVGFDRHCASWIRRCSAYPGLRCQNLCACLAKNQIPYLLPRRALIQFRSIRRQLSELLVTLCLYAQYALASDQSKICLYPIWERKNQAWLLSRKLMRARALQRFVSSEAGCSGTGTLRPHWCLFDGEPFGIAFSPGGIPNATGIPEVSLGGQRCISPGLVADCISVKM